jgi:hypothetical protein
MDEITEIIQKTRDYPRFPDGRIDYSKERVCYVLNCIPVCENEVLLSKRASNVIAYPNTINGISGFIDKVDRSIADQAKDELSEEVNAPLGIIKRMIVGRPIVQLDNGINREWHVYPILAEFKEKFEPKINWENKNANWYKLSSAKDLELMPGFAETLDAALRLRQE